jgi:hypothetical protein
MTNVNRLERVEHHVRNATSFRNPEGIFYFDGLPVGKGSEKEFEKMKNTLNEILQDNQLLNRLSDLDTSLQGLCTHIQKINMMANVIVKLVDQGLYDTTVKGCCSKLSLLRKI